MGNVQSQDSGVSNYATATAPTGASVVATVTAASRGLYEVHVVVRITTGANASLADNFDLRVAGTVIRRFVAPVVATTSNLVIGDYALTVRANAGDAITINAVGAEAAAVVYAASLWVRRIAD